MKMQVLKALANPARIFYVPYTLAVINFMVIFITYILVALILLPIKGEFIDPLIYFIVPLVVSHMIWGAFSKKDPQLGQVIAAKIQLFKKKIPRRLSA